MNIRKVIVGTLIFIGTALIFVGVILLTPTNNSKNLKSKSYNICEKISIAKEKKDTFIIVINSDINTNADINDAIFEFKEKYKNLTFYEIDVKAINNDCFKEVLDDTGFYENLLMNQMPTLIGYLNGVYTGLTQNPGDLHNLEKYFEENKIIKIKELKEIGLNYEQYIYNIKLEEYFLIIIADENMRADIDNSMKKVFPNKIYNIVNFKSDVGKKIRNDIKQRGKPENVYPQLFYFENSEILVNGKSVATRDFEKLKIKIEELS